MKKKIIFICAMLSCIMCSTSSQQLVKFAVIGDYGKWTTGGEALVSTMVHSWNPDFIITTGDNNYEEGSAVTIDSNIGKYYHDYIFPYTGIFGSGAALNKFFPSMGNHDWLTTNAQPYLNYFTLPNNERYYTFTKGNCQFFAINSDINEPDGYVSNSLQGNWLRAGLQNSTARFKIVYFHHPPYSSGQHGNTGYMQWPFKLWGATVVINGHDHNYERLVSGGLTYFVNGLGGKDWRAFGTIIPESRKRFTNNFGAMLVRAYQDSINFKFYSVPDSLKDDTTFVFPPLGIIKTNEIIPDNFSLEQNYPNPFNPVTKIKFSIPIAEYGGDRSILMIYDALGKEIETLVNEKLSPGAYEISWDATSYPTGIYFYQLSSGNTILTNKMVLIK